MACEKFRAVKHQFLATIFGRNYTIRYLLHIILSTVINFFFLSLSEHFVLCSGLEYGMVIASTTVVDVETKSTGRWSNIDGHGRLDWVISINWCSNGMLDSKLHIQLHWLQENHPAKWHSNHGKFSQNFVTKRINRFFRSLECSSYLARQHGIFVCLGSFADFRGVQDY